MMALMLASASTMSQVSWQQQNSGTSVDLYAVQFLDANNGFACGASGTVLKTTDGGVNWTDVSPASTQPMQALSFVSANEGWVVAGDESGWPLPSSTSGEVWKTINGGSDWTQQTFPNEPAARLGVFFLSPTVGWICGTHGQSTWPYPPAYKTTNGGTSWTGGTSALTIWTYDMHFESSTLGWQVGDDQSSTGVIQKTTDGSSWTEQLLPIGDALYAIEFTDASNGFAVGDYGSILRTANGGTDWTQESSGTTENLREISFATSLLGFTCGENGTILSTADGGNTWSAEGTGTSVLLRGVFALDATHAWAVGDSGTILRWSGAVGFESARDTTRVSVSPNPFHNTIQVQTRGQAGPSRFQLLDVMGKVVFEEMMHSDRGSWNLSIPAGVYLYRVEVSDGLPLYGKVVCR